MRFFAALLPLIFSLVAHAQEGGGHDSGWIRNRVTHNTVARGGHDSGEDPNKLWQLTKLKAPKIRPPLTGGHDSGIIKKNKKPRKGILPQLKAPKLKIRIAYCLPSLQTETEPLLIEAAASVTEVRVDMARVACDGNQDLNILAVPPHLSKEQQQEWAEQVLIDILNSAPEERFKNNDGIEI